MTTHSSMDNSGRRTIVIGGGIGGLAAALRMQASGFPTLLLEKRHQLGGRAGVFTKNGYTFDTGPTILTPPTLVDDLFSFAGRKAGDYVQLKEIKPKYRLYFSDGTQMEYGGMEDNLPQIERFNPHDVRGYQKFLKRVKPIYELGFEKFGSMPFETIWSMAKMGPAGVWHKAYKSVYGFVASYLKDERLRMAMSFNPLFIGGDPFEATAIYTLITYIEEKHGVWWVKGGTHKLVDGMERLFRELGGEVRLNSEVKQIEVSERRRVKGVTTADGTFHDADLVISNADVARSYTTMIDRRFRRRESDKRFRKAKYSMSLFMVYFGVRKQYPDMAHHSIVFGPRYKGLIKDIFKNRPLPDDFSTYLHIPTRTDPELAPPGCETMYACTPVSNLDNGIDWEERKESFKEHILSTLDRRVLPGLLDNLDVVSVFTPKDYDVELNSYKGAAFSLRPTLLQSGFFRPHNRSQDVKGLYLVGAGTHPGAGVPSVLMSAALTTKMIMRDIQRGKV
ncbi:MAG: phytoene desaturase [Candidatus Thorarchaeota archaeon]|nr:phytoene desaturase [Candidatus Thorarchaeota archaeon]